MTENLCTKRDARQLKYIVEYCNDIQDTVEMFGSNPKDFRDNIQYQRSCAFIILQIGERVKRLSGDLTSRFPNVEWRDIAGFRDVLSHNYENVNILLFWNTIIHDIPKLKKSVNRF